MLVAWHVQELADCMAGDKSIGAQEAAFLAKLIENKYPPVIQAYEDYATSQVQLLVSDDTLF